MSNDWVHCNICYTLPSSSMKFFLTSCGRVCCHKCITNALKEKCLSCAGQKCNAIEVNSQMRAETKAFFMDPSEVMKKQHKQLIGVIDYQKTQRAHIFTYFKSQQKKMQQLFEYAQQENKKRQELAKEVAALKEQNRQLLLSLQQQSAANVSSKSFVTSSNAFRAPSTPQTINSSGGGISFRHTPGLNTTRTSTPHSGITALQRLTPTALANVPSSVQNPMSVGLTTPRLLGLDKSMRAKTPENNPYLNMWPKRASPMNV